MTRDGLLTAPSTVRASIVLDLAPPLRRAKHERVARASVGSHDALMELAPFLGRLIVAACLLLVGTVLIYGFGAGYFGWFAVPAPLNFVVASALLLSLALVPWRFVTRRL